MNNFKELNIWKDAMQMAKDIFVLTKQFPADEKFGLISQINRSVVSIPSNIAEGCGRSSKKEFRHFLAVALGSSYELETQLILAQSFGYINEEKLKELQTEINKNQKMTAKLMVSLVESPTT